MKQIRRHLTYANVMSSLAVFFILGGATAFAAIQKVGPNEIKANSIKTGKIVKEAVTAGKIKSNAVIESKIADGAVTTNKIADNAVTTPKIAKDAVTTEKIANDAVTGDKVKESTLGEVPNAGNAASLGGKPAAEYSIGVFARIEAAGTLDATKSKNVAQANVTRVAVGKYCFSGLNPAPLNAVATTQFFNDYADLFMGSYGGCPVGTQVSVATWEDGGNAADTADDTPFTILFN